MLQYEIVLLPGTVMLIRLDRHAHGALEAELMHLLWAHGPMAVRQLYKLMLRDREIACTTVVSASADGGKGIHHSLRLKPLAWRTSPEPTVSRADLLIEIAMNALDDLNATDADRIAAPAALARTLP